ncbi:hypothetical protein EU245_05665 [Lentibacillus lipolyticus]|nr:hypothetical protein EU245_05665 [Lentibacillus lipolyticus]
MNRRFSRFAVPKWMKWTAGTICFIAVSCLVTGIYLYHITQKERTAEFDAIKRKALEETKLSTANQVERFHGKDAYYVIHGATDNKQAAILFYPFAENDAEPVLVDQTETMKEATVKSNWLSNCNDCTLFDITPALITGDQLPAWEITYENEAGRYIMKYVSMNNGELLEMIGFKQIYN